MRVLIFVAVLIGLAAPASAAQFSSGVFLGVTGGWARSHVPVDVAGVNVGDLGAAGGAVGPQLGYQFVAGPMLVAAVADWSWSSIKSTLATAAVDSKLDQIATFRARVGVPIGRVMVYGTGGAAYGHLKASAGGTEVAYNRWGWTLGGGVAVLLGDRWAAHVEYLRVDLGTVNDSAFGVSVNAPVAVDMVRGGLSYRF